MQNLSLKNALHPMVKKDSLGSNHFITIKKHQPSIDSMD